MGLLKQYKVKDELFNNGIFILKNPNNEQHEEIIKLIDNIYNSKTMEENSKAKLEIEKYILFNLTNLKDDEDIINATDEELIELFDGKNVQEELMGLLKAIGQLIKRVADYRIKKMNEAVEQLKQTIDSTNNILENQKVLNYMNTSTEKYGITQQLIDEMKSSINKEIKKKNK